ncbi:site-specific DNA-methyltransferase [Parasphingorhabdus sp.]|uniref:site-specific DNA-methyltransferase n=1 Tax=Parasphingorhabdus sp. TaxID=2709688 RepID=UPI003001B297
MPELNFKGKEFVYNHHLTVPFRPLKIHPDKGIGEPTLDGNLIIHGDNLHGLKALLPTHAGKVDCIFIDPPYNTGEEQWCYNDNVNSPMIKEWLTDNPIGIDDGLRHDKWASMMWPRLRLLHELLSDDGSFWMTIDDNEIHHARQLLDGVFGDDKFIACCVWQKRYSRENREAIGDVHDYVLVYSKSPGVFKALRNKLTPTEGQLKVYTNANNDPKGRWRGIPMTAQGSRKNQMYPIKTPKGAVHLPPEGRCWSMIESEFKLLEKKKRIWFGQDDLGQPNVIRYIDEVEGFVPWTWWPSNEVGHTDEAKKEMHSIFGKEDAFPTPKPKRLLKRIIEIATRKDSIVLDSFAGSATTAHATLDANLRDGGCRKFIMIEGEDYADKLTAERVRRAINGYAFKGSQKDELLREPLTFTKLKNAAGLMEQVQKIETLDGPKYDKIAKTVKEGALIVTGERSVDKKTKGLGGTFTYCTLGNPIDMDGLLTGDELPAANALAGLLFHTATNQAFDPSQLVASPDIGEGVHRLGSANGRHFWLFYKPELDWLKSGEAALTLSNARAIAATETGDHLVFAPAKFVSRELLETQKLPVEYAPLPYALYRVETA